MVDTYYCLTCNYYDFANESCKLHSREQYHGDYCPCGKYTTDWKFIKYKKKLTHKEYNKLAEELQSRGYKKYPSPRLVTEDYAWFKSFGKSKFAEDRSNYQIWFDVFDFSPYADREPFFRDEPFGFEPLVLISRTIDERIDLQLSHTKVNDNNIDEIERIAESFHKWAEKEIEIWKLKQSTT